MRQRDPRRLVTRLAAVALVVALGAAACDNGDASAERTPSAEKTPSDVPGFDGKTIKLGVITPLSGLASVVGKPLTNGNSVYWQSKNARGGVGGKYQVELVQEDSKYQVEDALQAYDRIKDDVVAFQQILGTQIVKTILPRLRARDGFAGPATLDSLWVKEPNLMPIGAPYQVESANGLSWYLDNGGEGKRLCAIAQDDEYGAAGLEGVRFAAGEENVEIAKTVRFATTSDVSAQVGELADANCEAVFLVSLPNDTISIATKMIGRNFSPQIIGVAPTWLAGLENDPNLGSFFAQNFIWVGEGPRWGDTSVEGMAKLITDLQQYSPDQKPDQYFAFGYAQAWAMDQILERAVENDDLSKEGILEASTQVGTLRFQGLIGDYEYGKSADDRNPPRRSTIAKVAAGQPIGLQILETNFTSDTAKDFDFNDQG